MHFQQRSLPLLAFASLLFGNVAGWVHVGCHHHGLIQQCCQNLSIWDSHCCEGCQDHTDQSHQGCRHVRVALSPSLDSNDAFVKAVAAGQVVAENSGGTQIGQETGVPTPGQPMPCERDSQRCSICQSFFTTRTAIVPSSAVVVSQPTDFSTQLIPDTLQWIASVELTGLSVRGPPRA
jgi:hypothetical protein